MYLDLQLLSPEARTWPRVVARKSYNPNPSPAHTLPRTKPRVATNKASCSHQQNVTTLTSCGRQQNVTTLTSCGRQQNVTTLTSCGRQQNVTNLTRPCVHTATNKASCGRQQKVTILTRPLSTHCHEQSLVSPRAKPRVVASKTLQT